MTDELAVNATLAVAPTVDTQRMDRDRWHDTNEPLPELREALLRRFATDLAVVVADVESQRPADMPCCWVTYERPWPPVPGRTTTWAADICRGSRCHHVHHLHEIFLA